MGEKKNAVLVWKGRKLMCNGVKVGSYWQYYLDGSWSFEWAGMMLVKSRKTESAARGAINRKFGLPLDLGETK